MDRAVLELFDKIVQEPISLKSAESLAEIINMLSQHQRGQLLALLLCASQGRDSYGLLQEVHTALKL